MRLKTWTRCLGLALAFGPNLLAAGPAPDKDPWEGLRFLAGDWTGSGGGEPGHGTGDFSFTFELGGKILVRKSRVVYPPQPGRKEGLAHEDLMVLSLEGDLRRAVYFDNEGHVIHYQVSTGPGQATFESDAAPGAPRFRLKYEIKAQDSVTIDFAVAPPESDEYKTYVSGSARRRGSKG